MNCQATMFFIIPTSAVFVLSVYDVQVPPAAAFIERSINVAAITQAERTGRYSYVSAPPTVPHSHLLILTYLPAHLPAELTTY